MFKLNPQSGEPIYRQLMDQIRRMIDGGQLKPADSMPSVRQLALSHGVNPNTISKAYGFLEVEGYLERHRGKTMTVSLKHVPKSCKEERLCQIQAGVDQLTMAGKQLGLNTEDLVNAIRKSMEKYND